MRIIGVELRYVRQDGMTVEIGVVEANIKLAPTGAGHFNATVHTDQGDFNLDTNNNRYDQRFTFDSAMYDPRID